MKKQWLFLLLLPCLLFAFRPPIKSDGKGTWKVLKTKNDPGGRSECALAAAGGKLYLIGGDGGDALPVECLDPNTLTWTKLAPAPSILHHFEAVAVGTKIYVLEAFASGGFPNQDPMANVQIFDTQTNTWSTGGEIPAARRRAAAGAAFYNGKFYLACGIQHGHSSGTNAMFDVYDPVAGTWSALPDAPHIRDHCFAVVVGDKLYVAGGRNTSFRDPANKLNFFSQVELNVDCYDFKTGTWSTLPAKLPKGTGGGNLVNLNNKLYYLGGERATATENNAPRNDVFVYDPAAGGQWQAIDTLNLARNGVGAAVLNGKIYIAGGAGGPGGFQPGGPGGPPPGGPMPGDTSHRPQPNMRPPGGGGGGSIGLEVFTLK